jgi:hypothetical protein
MKVYAATYEHRHGSDTRVFKTADSAESWRVSIALKWWVEEFGDEPMPTDPDEAANEYWERIEDEWFNYDAVPLEE